MRSGVGLGICIFLGLRGFKPDVCRFRVRGLGIRVRRGVQGLGLRLRGLEFRVYGWYFGSPLPKRGALAIRIGYTVY